MSISMNIQFPCGTMLTPLFGTEWWENSLVLGIFSVYQELRPQDFDT